jgi:Fanconi anemia group M protein
MLGVGDFIVSQRCGVEFKHQEDFVQSMIDGRLLEQLRQLKQAYERPIIIVEGDKDLFALRNVHPNSIRGMLAAIAVAYGVPVLATRNSEETVSLLWAVAEREQNENGQSFSPRAHKPATAQEQVEHIVSSIPGVGPAFARQLLKQFSTVRKVVNATPDKLKEVLGEKRASSVDELLDRKCE